MSNFEDELRGLLRERTRKAPTPPGIRRKDFVKVRASQAGAFLAVALVVGLVVPAASRSLQDGNGTSDIHKIAGPSGDDVADLYVVDEKRGFESQVLALDGDSGQIQRRYDAYDDPAVAVSPDGSTLYIASLHPEPDASNLQDFMEVIDAKTGKVLAKAPLDNLRWQFAGTILFPTLSMSASGDAIYILESDTRVQDQYEDYVGVFDTDTRQLLPGKASLGRCGGGTLLPTREAGSLAVVCPESHDVRFLTFGFDGSVTDASTVRLPEGHSGGERGSVLRYLDRVSWATISPDGQTLYAVTGGGQVSVIDVPTQRVHSNLTVELPPGSSVSMNKVALVDEGRALALGVGDASGRGLVEADALIFFDTSSWERIGDPVNLDPFWSMEESGDGVLTVGVASPRLDLIMPAAKRPSKSFNGVGMSPRIVVTP